MPSIRGRYEYDDDSLRPGKKKEGGLHQNLFDDDGNLRASARFVPDDGDDPDPVYVHVYIDDSPRGRSKEDEELEEAVSRFLLVLLAVGIDKAKPHAKRLWEEKARPALAATWDERPLKRKAERQLSGVEPVVVVATPIVEPSDDLAVASQEYGANMSSAEAQARYLIALAAKAFSDEQMKLLANANIEDGLGLAALKHGLAQLPAKQVAQIIGTLESNPASLTDGSVDVDTILANRGEET